mmetsp:Transcript_30775/g.73859  ORF Transcript_30775/g.73859 Transcript_30775/m.73859 type:complete len:257 (-) Transcript_30775:3894-4664(-)
MPLFPTRKAIQLAHDHRCQMRDLVMLVKVILAERCCVLCCIGISERNGRRNNVGQCCVGPCGDDKHAGCHRVWQLFEINGNGMGTLLFFQLITRVYNGTATSQTVHVINGLESSLARIHQTGGIQKLGGAIELPNIRKNNPLQVGRHAVLLSLGENTAGSAGMDTGEIHPLFVVFLAKRIVDMHSKQGGHFGFGLWALESNKAKETLPTIHGENSVDLIPKVGKGNDGMLENGLDHYRFFFFLFFHGLLLGRELRR